MAREFVHIFDTTLRDGAQTHGVDFSVADKIRIIEELDQLGLEYIECGFPGANPTDSEVFAHLPKTNAALVAFGMTRRVGRSASNDPGFQGVMQAGTDHVCLVGKSWDYQVEVALEATLEDNLAAIKDSFEHAVLLGKKAMFDAEHFFDGFRANQDYAIRCLEAALVAGVSWVVLCDTNGGTLPDDVHEIVGKVCDRFGGDKVGFHGHNDTGCAVANSLAAVDAGARQVQGTINGLGERCGNADLCVVIPNLVLKPNFADRFDTGKVAECLPHMTMLSHRLDDIINRVPDPHKPYVGRSAFAHKGGLHVSAVQRDPATYEHVDPAEVGNKRIIPMSDQAGRANVLARLKASGIDVIGKEDRIGRLLDVVKDKEHHGFAYDLADASFAVLALRELGQLPSYFEVESFRVSVERRFNAVGDLVTQSEATVKILVDGERIMSVGEGNGPVHALDMALRKDLGCYSEYIQDLELVDFKVRILDGGTGAVTRVLVDCMDQSGEGWTTVGVSPNIVDASFQALIDAVNYKLYRQHAQSQTG
ncbi:MAG: citramalate synthase [SAR116 cluster bacterium]|nr:citramalate synthase [Paracoccaceae bacterium]RCL81793.1 MAG: citramalate synthase [SAR116 cluster bacterium]RPH14490.1 MAG: citramalate synthase [Alphaproteobacteria bacterium TMED150]HBQ23113.1 citramalate synthase [Alphaproteobacteria bacterium]|tara:strand:+ start:762 stop:2366 length:1605 start_codon:yes stop_codon:yes gene_type:complete